MQPGRRDSMAHVLVFPGPSQGHINPMLQFSKRLTSKGIKATLVTTVFISKSMDAEVDSVTIETISDGYDEGGYDSAESPEDYNMRLKEEGSKTLTKLIQKYESSDCPFTCLLYDPFYPWALDIAKLFGLVGAAFFTQSCAVFAIYYHASRGCLTIPSTMQEVEMPGLPPLAMFDLPSFITNKGSYSHFLTILLDQYSNLDKADWILINSFDKLEAEVLNCLTSLWQIKTVGPTLPSMYLDKRIKGDTGYGLHLWKPNVHACMKWLDNKEERSVVYVSFGSLAKLGAEQMEELSWGLKRSNKYFLWVVRDSEKIKLPKKFQEETSSKGLIVGWCSQLEVLAHSAVGCFVTHCGWNSTLEGLSLGVPFVAIPQWSDQPTNAKYVEAIWGVGVRARMDEKGIVRKEEIEMCVREVMESSSRGEILRKHAFTWKELAKEAFVAGGSSDKNIEEFVAQLSRVKMPR